MQEAYFDWRAGLGHEVLRDKGTLGERMQKLDTKYWLLATANHMCPMCPPASKTRVRADLSKISKRYPHSMSK
mgnify:FL=1